MAALVAVLVVAAAVAAWSTGPTSPASHIAISSAKPSTGTLAPAGGPTASVQPTSPAPGTPGPSPSQGPSPSPLLPSPGLPGGTPSRFGLGLLIADRGNGRLLIVNDAGKTLWSFPGPGSLPAGQQFAADDAFISPDGLSIVANDESHQVIDRIDIVSRRVIWQYGRYNRSGSAAGFLHTPDDAYPLANGNITVADIRNCRILEIDPAKRIVSQMGRTGLCRHHPPTSFNQPNGDTPLPDGGMLVTEIGGSRVVRLSKSGQILADLHVPVAYPSDAQLIDGKNILVVDYSNPGAVLIVSPSGRVLWRYHVTSGPGRLNHPSLAIALRDGTIALNDDERHRVVVIDPRTGQIVWQYGHTDRASSKPGYLSVPDGIDLVPLGTHL